LKTFQIKCKNVLRECVNGPQIAEVNENTPPQQQQRNLLKAKTCMSTGSVGMSHCKGEDYSRGNRHKQHKCCKTGRKATINYFSK